MWVNLEYTEENEREPERYGSVHEWEATHPRHTNLSRLDPAGTYRGDKLDNEFW